MSGSLLEETFQGKKEVNRENMKEDDTWFKKE